MKKFLFGLLKVLFVVKEIITMPISVLIVGILSVMFVMTCGYTFKEFAIDYWYLYKLTWKYLLKIDDVELIPEYIEKYYDEVKEHFGESEEL